MLQDGHRNDDEERCGHSIPDGSSRSTASRDTPFNRIRKSILAAKSIIIALLAFVAASAALISNIKTIKESIFPQRLAQILAEDYVRLTGALEVPFLIDNGRNAAKCGKESDCPSHEGWADVGAFWKKHELNKAHVLRNEVLTTDDYYFGIKAIFDSNRDPYVMKEVYCLIKKADGGTSLFDRRPFDEQHSFDFQFSEESIKEYLGVRKSANFDMIINNINHCYKDISHQIGFLFLRIRNVSDRPVTSLKLYYKKIPEDRHEDWHESNSPSIKFLDYVEKHGVKSWNDYLAHAADRNAEKIFASNIRTDSTFGPDLKPNEDILWPLEIYRARTDKFERYFFRDWLLPIKIEFMVDGTRRERELRWPRRRNASPIAVPHGWYQQ